MRLGTGNHFIGNILFFFIQLTGKGQFGNFREHLVLNL